MSKAFINFKNYLRECKDNLSFDLDNLKEEYTVVYQEEVKVFESDTLDKILKMVFPNEYKKWQQAKKDEELGILSDSCSECYDEISTVKRMITCFDKDGARGIIYPTSLLFNYLVAAYRNGVMNIGEVSRILGSSIYYNAQNKGLLEVLGVDVKEYIELQAFYAKNGQFRVNNGKDSNDLIWLLRSVTSGYDDVVLEIGNLYYWFLQDNLEVEAGRKRKNRGKDSIL